MVTFGRNLWKIAIVLGLVIGAFFYTKPVHALGTPQIISINPGSPSPIGTTVSIHATVTWDSDFRSMRICFRDENWCQEDATPDITKNFDTSGLSAGTYTIIAEVASQGQGWDTANKTYGSYELTSQPISQSTQAPSSPSKGPNLSIFEFSPNSVNVGDSVDIHVVVNSSNPGATKINVGCGGVSKTETSEVDFYSTWSTNGCAVGEAQVTVLTRDVNDPNWSNSNQFNKSYYLSVASTTIPVPSVSFHVDNANIQSGQCTTLYWDTQNADSVDIDGQGVSASGSEQTCPSVTQKYTLSAHNQSGTASRNITITVTTQLPTPSIIDSFNTGDIVNISGNIYVIVKGQRRHIPNPDTLDALGISRGLIDNRGFSDADLNTIPQGSDIPDINVDPSGFQSFKNLIFPNNIPINPVNPISTLQPTAIVTTLPTQPSQSNSSQNPSQPTQDQTNQNGQSQTCKVTPYVRVNPGLRLGEWFALIFPNLVHEPYQIFYKGNPVPTDDTGIRHDGFLGHADDGTIWLGISTSHIAIPQFFSGLFDSNNWSIQYPC